MSLDLANLLAAPGQPETLYRALDATTKSRVGHKLFTLLRVDGSEVARVYSNQPEAYPVFGRKPMGPTPWGALVMEGRQPFLGRDMEAIRWAFFDHALIASLGCGSVINIPIVYDGETIGTMNLLDAEHHYTEADIPKVAELAPLLIPAFLIARNQA
jgi:hypothetical protein